jgi:RNA polymerase sigma factor for flagellar operon FliA
MYEGTSHVSTADEAEVLVDSEDDEPVGNTMTPAEINALIEEHVPLVKHIVFQVAVHFPRHVEREELARAGALGLVEAAQRYSPERGIPFQRFAARRVRGAMIDSVRAADWAPRSVRRLSRRFDAMEQQLASELGRAPQTKETAEALGMKPAEVSKLRSQLYWSVVLALEHDVGGESGEDLNLLDILPDRANLEPDEQLEGRELYAYLQDAISLLPERHRLVIVGYFLEEKTSAELARFLGVTESRVSQLRSDAVEMLRQGITSQYEDVEADSETGLRAERRKKYANAIGEASDWRDRLDEGAELSTDIRTVL